MLSSTIELAEQECHKVLYYISTREAHLGGQQMSLVERHRAGLYFWPGIVYKILVQARTFVQRGWQQNARARRNDGMYVEPTDPDAVMWSVDGAITAATNQVAFNEIDAAISYSIAESAMLWLDHVAGYSSKVWNDVWGRNQDDALNLYDLAIQLRAHYYISTSSNWC